MNNDIKYFKRLQKELVQAAQEQDDYDTQTINLIAPASPTPLKYFYNLPLKHNAIAEGLLGKRPYAGVSGFNKIESIAVEAACRLFHADHANVQPHSVSQANQAAYQALLENGDHVLAMKFHDGGHLTHGLHLNFSGRFFSFNFYGIDKNGLLDYADIEKQTLSFKPKMIVCGASSYPRIIDFQRLAHICKKVGAYLLADVSHPAGLIVTDHFPQPFPHCDVVTFTPDKTMLGPHGGIILCKSALKANIDKAVHPGVQSSVPLRRIYQMAQCLIDASKPDFAHYINRVLKNMRVFEKVFIHYPGLMVTGGTDTHLLVLDTYNTFGLTGKEAEILLEDAGILTNRQVIPSETLKPYVASGIRLGASWITARGYTEHDTKKIADGILAIFENPANMRIKTNVKSKMKKLLIIQRKHDVWKDEVS